MTTLSLEQFQSIARIVVGQSEQANPVPTIDFAGRIKYSANGTPTSVSPVANSGYSVGTVQWDFGARSAAVDAFVDAYSSWAQSHGIDPWSSQSKEAITTALSSDGSTLQANPTSALSRGTVNLLNQFLANPAGSGWVNTNLVDPTIGTNEVDTYNQSFGENYGKTLVAIGSEVAASLSGSGMSTYDLGLASAWGMKLYNQSPTTYGQYISFLNGGANGISDISRNFIGQLGNQSIGTGLSNTTAAYNAYSAIASEAAAPNADPIFSQVEYTLNHTAMQDPATLSGDPSYTLGKVLLSNGDQAVHNFANALESGRTLEQGLTFDSDGYIRLNSRDEAGGGLGGIVVTKDGYAVMNADTTGYFFPSDGSPAVPIGWTDIRKSSDGTIHVTPQGGPSQSSDPGSSNHGSSDSSTSPNHRHRHGSHAAGASKNFKNGQHDPLIIDLAGTGFNIISQSISSPNFDYAGNGFANSTSWVGQGTGFLAIDANANGKVDNGTELFTTFDQLRGLVTNGDGVIDSSDVAFSQLAIWQDTNADGVTEQGEMRTLSELGIRSISLNVQNLGQRIGDTTITQVALITMVDGTTRTIGAANFSISTLYTDYVGSYTLDSTVQSLPNLAGYGTLPDLRISMSQDSELKSLVQQLIQVDPSNVAAFDNALQNVLYRWAGSDTVAPTSGGLFDGQKLAFLRKFLGNNDTFLGNSVTPLISAQPIWVQNSWSVAFSGLKARILSQLSNSPFVSAFRVDQSNDLILPNASIGNAIEALGRQAPIDAASSISYWVNALTLITNSVADLNQHVPLDSSFILSVLQNVAPPMFSDQILAAAAGGLLNLVEGTALNSRLEGTSGADLFIATQANSILDGRRGSDEFIVGSGLGTIEIIENDDPSVHNNSALLLDANVPPSAMTVSGNASGDIFLNLGNGDQIKIDGMLNSAGNGVQEVIFADGTIWTAQQVIQKELTATAGDDRLYGSYGADIIDGKGGNDYAHGGGGGDTFIFNLGYGKLEISETDQNSANTNKIQLGVGITPDQVTVSSDHAGNLILTIGSNGDAITIDGMLVSSRNGVQQVQFADGTIWTTAQLISKADTGSAGNADLSNFLGNVTFDSAGFAHRISSNGGNDTILFNSGYGFVEISQHDVNTTDENSLVFGAGIDPAQVSVSCDQSGNVLLTIGSNGDVVKLDSMLYGPSNGVQTVRFADGTVWSAQQIIDMLPPGSGTGTGYFTTYNYRRSQGEVTISTAGIGTIAMEDVAKGDVILQTDQAGDLIVRSVNALSSGLVIQNDLYRDIFGTPRSHITRIDTSDGLSIDLSQSLVFTWFGSLGSQTISGSTLGARNIFFGAAGNTLNGARADEYHFGADAGVEVINPASDANVDTIVFDATVDPADVTLQASGNDLIVTDEQASMSITVKNDLWNSFGTRSHVGTIAFSNGTGIDLTKPITLTWDGTAGNVTLNGSNWGAHNIFFGADGDILNGAGADTYYFSGSSGTEWINPSNYNDTIVFDASVHAADLNLKVYNGRDLSITDQKTGLSITVNNEFWYDYISRYTYGGITYQAGGAMHARVGDIVFSDGMTWNALQQSMTFIWNGTLGATLYGSSYGDNIFNFGLGGNETAIGSYTGTANTYVFGKGDGAATVDPNGASGTIVLGSGINAADVSVSRNPGGDITLTLLDTGDSLTILRGYNIQNMALSLMPPVHFTDGTIWSPQQIISKLPILGASYNTQLIGTTGADTFDSLGYARLEIGNGGGDTFRYNAGYGFLEISEIGDSTHTNVLQLGPGIDPSQISVTTYQGRCFALTDGISGDEIILDGMVTSVNNGVQEIHFADGTVWTQQQILERAGQGDTKTLYGTTAADTLDSKGFANLEIDYGGGDTFIYSAGYGNLEIQESGTGADTNILQFGFGIDPSQVTVTSDGNNVYLTDNVAGDQIKLDNMWFNPNYGVQQIRFADGTVWTPEQLAAMEMTPSVNNTEFYGTYGNDILDSKGIADWIAGLGGSDTYIYNAGYGYLDIYDDTFGSNSGDINTVQFGPGIDPSQVIVTGDDPSYDDGNIYLTDGISGDKIVIDNMLQNPHQGIQQISFADGTIWTRQQILAMEMTGTPNNTVLYGTSGADTIDSKGYATFESGGGGADTFIYNVGYGQLEISEWNSYFSSVLQFGAGIDPADVSVTGDIEDTGSLYLAVGSNGDQVQLDYMAWDQLSGVQQVRFADGTVWTGDQLRAMMSVGTANSDTIAGTSGDDLFDGRGGTDIINGGGGNDTYIFRQGYGSLTINNGTTDGTTAQGQLDFGSGISSSNLWFNRTGNDLQIDVLGTTDQVKVKDWFGSNPSAALAEIHTTDGQEIDAHLNQLVSAMATFSASNPGFDPTQASAMPSDSSLQSTLASAWHSAA